MEESEILEVVRREYGKIAREAGSGCGSTSSCCSAAADSVAAAQENRLADVGQAIGYSREEMDAVPEGANLGLGCGNPLALAGLERGETVLDLGSGAGFDSFLAARKVGERGKVIGVDMTEEMVEKARENARRGGYSNVEFRLGRIESLPVVDASVDLVISNCVINLSPDKERVFREAFRVLKPGGRLAVSDIVLRNRLPRAVLESAAAYAGCIAGASLRKEYLRLIREAGFMEVRVAHERRFGEEQISGDPFVQSCCQESGVSQAEAESMARSVVSLSVQAVKPV